MKSSHYKIVLLLLVLFLYNESGFSGFFMNYFKSRYYVKMVKELPDDASNRIFVISTRNIKPEKEYKIKKGLNPRYELFFFNAGLKNDTAFIQPVKAIDAAREILPKEKDFLVYVDGHGKNFGQTIERGFLLTSRYNINVIVFDWPTDYYALRKSMYNATEVSVDFVKAMRTFNDLYQSHYSSSAVSVIFHSLGNNILRNIVAFNLLPKMPRQLFSNIIINAAAVKQRNHVKWVEKLDIQERIYITMNNQDVNLRGAMLIRLTRQLGISNLNSRARNAFYVNFSDILTTEHNLFMDRTGLDKINPFVFQFYNTAFHGKEINTKDVVGFQIFSPSEWDFLTSDSTSFPNAL